MNKSSDRNQSLQPLDDEGTKGIAGGFLIGGKHLAKTYKSAGINVIKHTWKSNEFIINKTGRKISKSDANKIVDLYKLDCNINGLEKELQAHINQEVKNGRTTSLEAWYDQFL